MSYSDIDQSNKAQYDLWWRIEELDDYSRRRGQGDLDIVKYLLGLPDTHPASPEDRTQVAYAFLGDAGRERFMTGSRSLNWA